MADKRIDKYLLFLLLLSFTLISCNSVRNRGVNEGSKNKIENTSDPTLQLVGSWKDCSPAALHFTLFKDGTAQSDNMKTLLYKKWTLKGDIITFTIESIGNKTSSTIQESFQIEKLSDKQLILRKGNSIFKYTKIP